MQFPRGYHSSYLLLPDGRIWVSGSEQYGRRGEYVDGVWVDSITEVRNNAIPPQVIGAYYQYHWNRPLS